MMKGRRGNGQVSTAGRVDGNSFVIVCVIPLFKVYFSHRRSQHCTKVKLYTVLGHASVNFCLGVTFWICFLNETGGWGLLCPVVNINFLKFKAGFQQRFWKHFYSRACETMKCKLFFSLYPFFFFSFNWKYLLHLCFLPLEELCSCLKKKPKNQLNPTKQALIGLVVIPKLIFTRKFWLYDMVIPCLEGSNLVKIFHLLSLEFHQLWIQHTVCFVYTYYWI